MAFHTTFHNVNNSQTVLLKKTKGVNLSRCRSYSTEFYVVKDFNYLLIFQINPSKGKVYTINYLKKKPDKNKEYKLYSLSRKNKEIGSFTKNFGYKNFEIDIIDSSKKRETKDKIFNRCRKDPNSLLNEVPEAGTIIIEKDIIFDPSKSAFKKEKFYPKGVISKLVNIVFDWETEALNGREGYSIQGTVITVDISKGATLPNFYYIYRTTDHPSEREIFEVAQTCCDHARFFGSNNIVIEGDSKE